MLLKATILSLDVSQFKDIEPESSLWKALPLSIQIKIVKKVKTGGFWPRLLLDKVRRL
jgi:hypothetical protein